MIVASGVDGRADPAADEAHGPLNEKERNRLVGAATNPTKPCL